jgi:hypothetical protein
MLYIFFADRTSSERFLASLENCWEKDVHLEDLCSSVIKPFVTSANARVAATACLNQMLVAPTLKNLMYVTFITT